MQPPKPLPVAPTRTRDVVVDLMRRMTGLSVQGVTVMPFRKKLTAKRMVQHGKQQQQSLGMPPACDISSAMEKMSVHQSRGEKRNLDDESPYMSDPKQAKH